MNNNKVNILDIIIKVIIVLIIIVVIIMIYDNYISKNRIVFELKGESSITINIGEQFVDPGYTIYKGEEDLHDKVVINDNIDINTIGTYERTYTYENKELKRTIEVKKIKEFILNGESDVYILINGKYDDPKATATLNGEDYSSTVLVLSSCNTSKSGTCKITYRSNELNRVLERRIHVSDFKEYFKIDAKQGQTSESIVVSITIDKDKVKEYILPDGTTKTDNDSFTITKNDVYTFTIIDKYDNKYERKIDVKSIVKPLTASCSATVKNNETTINVKANKEIVKYVYNGKEGKENTYKFDTRYTTNKVHLIDVDNLEVDLTCKTTIKAYNSFGAYKHVIIIGADGLGAALTKVDAPNFKNIFGNYAYKHDSRTEDVTISAQNWGSILTGVAYNTHGFTNDSIAKNTRNSNSRNHSIFYYVRQAYPKANLVSIVNWEPINHGIIETDLNVKKMNYGSDNEVTNNVIKYLDSNSPTLMYIHFDEADHAAHASGGFSNEYYTAVKKIDTLIGKIYKKISDKGMMNDTLVILVADHGETKGGHGGNSKEERSAILAVRGHSVKKTNFDGNLRNRDVAAITLYALGIKVPSHFVSKVPSGLFGEPR